MSKQGDKRKRIYWRAFAASLALLLPAEALGWAWLRRLAILPTDELLARSAVWLVLPFLLASSLASGVCRLLGVPLSRRATETLVRACRAKGFAESMSFQVAEPPSASLWVWGSQFFVAAMAVVSKLHLNPLLEWLLEVLSLALLVATVVAMTESRATIEVDRDGVRRRTALRRWTKPIPWDEIGACTVETSTEHAMGESDTATCVFRDHGGEVLLRFPVLLESEAGAQFLKMVRSNQGLEATPSELLSSEAPAGTGLEPEAAAAPAGRGTEPVAVSPAMAAGGERQSGTAERGREGAP